MGWSERDRKGDTGLLDDYDFTVRSSRFGYTDYNNGDTCLWIIEGEAAKDGKLTDHHLWVKIGAFEPADEDGRFAIHESGDPEKRFHVNSHAQKFINKLQELGVPVEEKGESALDSQMIVGSKLHINVFEYHTKINGEEITYRQELPTAYLGEVGDAGTTTETSGGASAEATSNGSGSVDDAALAEIAKSTSSHMEFVEAAVKAGASIGDARVKDESFWTSNRS